MSNLVKTEYQGIPVSFTDEGWFNATAAAKRFGKAPNEWLRLPDTVSYLQGLERKYGKIPYFKTSRGSTGGTWLHPKLAVRFTQWLSVDFSIWCDEQIDRILHGEQPHPSDESQLMRSTVRDREPLYVNATLLMTRQGVSLPKAYRAANAFAGTKSLKEMNKDQATQVAKFLSRVLNRLDTRADWDRVESELNARRGQPMLIGLIIPPWSEK